MRRRLLIIPIMLSACGGPERHNGKDPPRTGTGTSGASLAPAHTTPERASSDALAAANLTVESAFAASILAGGTRLVTYGTLIESTRSWSPEPADRLIVDRGGRRFEITVTAMDGDFTDPNAFFSGNHLLEASVRTEGEDVHVRSLRSGASRAVALRGSMMVENVRYTFDLTTDGTEHFENDSSGSEYREAHRLTGIIDWSGAHLDVDERWEFNLVSANGEGGAVVTSAVRTIASELEEGGHRYVWQNVRLQKAFRDGRPNEIDSFWSAAGNVTRDGAHHGDYRLDAQLASREAGFLKFLLVLPSQTIEVESWKVY